MPGYLATLLRKGRLLAKCCVTGAWIRWHGVGNGDALGRIWTGREVYRGPVPEDSSVVLSLRDRVRDDRRGDQEIHTLPRLVLQSGRDSQTHGWFDRFGRTDRETTHADNASRGNIVHFEATPTPPPSDPRLFIRLFGWSCRTL